MEFNKDNTPNAAKLMESLRFSGYDNNIALADLVDNALDANATEIDIKIICNSSKEWTFVITDNGDGMNELVLSQALRLGSITERNIESDLGRFGMGLVTASISIARRVEVYTRANSEPTMVSVMDLDEMVRSNSFGVYRDKATVPEVKLAEANGLKNGGTLLILKKCDNITRSDPAEFVDSLSRYFGEIYRYFIRSGRKIKINGQEVKILDPMWQDGTLVEEYKKKSEMFSDEVYAIKLDNKKSENVSVKIFVLPDFDRTINKRLKINSKNQGFYILRNYRQIASGSDLNGLWDKHNDLNSVRVEVAFSGALDAAMGVNYTKHDIKPTQAVVDKFQNEIMPQISTLRKRFKKQHRITQSQELKFEEAEKIIAQKAKLLDKADDKVKEPRPVVTAKKPTKKKEVGTVVRRRRPSLSDIARFEDHSFGITGPIFDVEKQGKITVIQWNVDHPFYERFLLEYKDNADLVNAVSFLAYSIGESKLKYSREDTYEMLENIMSTISTNLRVLLS